jgi:hypothetical protein
MAPRNPLKHSELHNDAWERFERAVDVVAKSPPQHRSKKKQQAKRKRLRSNSDNIKNKNDD